jgi:hypothetical protein
MAIWLYTIRLGDIWKNPDLTFKDHRDRIVERLSTSRWATETGGEDSDLADLLRQLGEATDEQEFDDVWTEIYDLADDDRAWIELYSPKL